MSAVEAPFALGIDRFLQTPEDYVAPGARVGLLVHAASITSAGTHTVNAVLASSHMKLVRLFSPEHGVFGAAQDMVGVGNADTYADIPVKSLYGDTLESLWPEIEDLRGLDALIIDLQDIGTRYYTYIYTMAFCMERARDAGVRVIVCDRPNPLGGIKTEGRPQERGYCSFVGWYPLPVRHGKTIGELAHHFNTQETIHCELTVVDLKGWDRHALGMGPGRPWINPSPNMPNLQAALTYPGTCLIEGTNLSEGRGTTRPFEWIGAPFIDSKQWITALHALALPGVRFIPWSFEPMFQKWKGQTCHGVQIVITDPEIFLPYRTGLALIHTVHQLYPNDFKWRTEPYEFVSDRPAIDLLTGSSEFRKSVEVGNDPM